MNVTRRTFLALSTAAGAGLCLDFRLDGREAGPGPFSPNAFLRISPQGRVSLTVVRSEMGQGVRTSLAMVACDELGADWSRMDLEPAAPQAAFGDMTTGGSFSTQSTWTPLRKAAAAAREMLVQAAARIWGVPAAECAAREGEVRHAASGRRMGFGSLAAAARDLPVPQDPPLKDPSAFTLIGRPTKRFDGPRIVDGSLRYGLDLEIPGMVRAVLVRCPVRGGRARSWDAVAVKARPGVLDVVPVLGGAALAVVAQDTWLALSAAGDLKVEWDPGPARDFSSEAFRALLADLVRKPGAVARREGDPDRAAGRRVEALYEWPWLAHAMMEVPNAVARVDGSGCDVWTGTQAPDDLQARAARMLGLRPEAVRVHLQVMGGGFGRRLDNDIGLEALEVARALGRPVQVVWPRRDELAHDHFHPMSLHRMEAVVAGGLPMAWLHRVAAPSQYLATTDGKRDADLVPSETAGAADLPYRIPALRVEYQEAPCHLALGALRSVQEVPNVFARECFLDEVAAAAGKDPVALRRELLSPDRVLSLGDLRIETGRLRRTLDLAAERAGWGRPVRAGHGLGAACFMHFTGTYAAIVAEVSVERGDLRIHRIVAAVDCGLVVNPLGAAAQIEGGVVFALGHLRTRVTFREGRAELASLADYPVREMADTPPVEVHFVPSRDRPVGLGEPPVPPLAPAVLNAVFAATGRRLRRLPILPGDLA